MDMGLVAIIAIVTLLVGVFIGFLISKATGHGGHSGNLKNQMDSLQERFTSYQSEVITHFNTTAALSNKISQDYQEMQAHLMHSVESLVTDTDLRTKLLAELKQETGTASLGYDTVEGSSSDLDNKVTAVLEDTMPKDYAPKVPGEVGTLAEEFGVKHK